MSLFNKLSTIIGWTFLGAVSAYIVASIIVFSRVYGMFLLMDIGISGWIYSTLLVGMGTGFLVGMVKACVVDTIEATRKRLDD